jgi:hypothetical protein
VDRVGFTVVNVDVAAFWPSIISTVGQAVTEAEEADPMNLFLAVNDDDDNGDGVVDNEGASASSIDAEDDEMAALIVRQFAPSGLTGTLTMEIPAGLRIFSADGVPVSTPVTVDLSAPTGPLAGILTGDVKFFIEATATSSDAAVVLRFTPSVGSPITDAVHMTLTSTDVTGGFTRGSVQYAAAIKHAGRWYAGGTLDSNHPLSVLIPVPTGMVSVTTAQLEYRLESGPARMAVRLDEAYFQAIANFWNEILNFLQSFFPLWHPEPYTASYIANELNIQTGISVAELMDGHYFCMMNLDTAGPYQLTYSKGSTTPFSKEWLAVVKVEFIDEIPDYSLDSNTDSDNFFLREETAAGAPDFSDLKIYYKILPSGVTVDDVKIKIYNGDTATLAATINGETDASGAYKTGNGLLIKWTPAIPTTGSDQGFYRCQLQVFVGGSSTPICKTSMDDADTATAGWQCPQDGLGIHDLTWKHRPVIHLHTNEFSGPAHAKVMLDRADLLHDVALFPVVDAAAPVTHAILTANNSTAHYLRYTGTAAQQEAARIRTPTDGERAVYHHGVYVAGQNFTYLQSWQFEPSSFGIAAFADLSVDPMTFTHDGDWEMCQTSVRLAAPAPDSGDKSQWLSGYSVTASQHFRGQTLRWKEVGNGPGEADQDYVGKSGDYRPNVYTANRSHATYFRPNAAFRFALSGGDCLAYEAAPTGDARDDFTGNTSYTYSLILLTNTIIANWLGDWSTQGVIPNLRSPLFRESGGEVMYTNPRGFNNRFLKTGNDSNTDPAYIP